MKRSISLVLCLVMLLSIFSVCGVVAGAADANDAMYIKSSGFENDRITYTVYLKKNVSLAGAIIKIKFDSAVLEPVMYWSDGGTEITDDDGYIFDNDGAYVKKDSYGDETYSVPGVYVSGMVNGSDNMCTVAYISMNSYETGSADKPFMTFKFKAIDSARPKTDVSFYCTQLESSDAELNIPPNDENPQLFYTHTTSTLNKTKHTSVYSIDGGLRVTWEPTAGATGYQIYKVVNGKSVLLDGDISATQNYFDDKTAVANEVSRYSVRAFNADGIDSAYAGTISGVYVKAPDRMTATIQAKGVKLNWTAVSGASNYRIYRRIINADGTRTAWVGLNTVPSSVTSYVDSADLVSGTHYEYTVRVFTSLGSSAVCRYATLNYYEAPTVKLASVKGGASVSWNAIDGATSYRVFRKYYGAKNWTQIAVVGSDTLNYIDTAAKSGYGISYTVRAYGENGSSAFVGKYFNYLQTPQLLGISNSASGVYFKWNKVAGATGYRLYRRLINQNTWTYMCTVTNTYYTDKTVKGGYHYKYTVIAVKDKIASGFDSTGLYIKFMYAPKLTKISNLSSGINVTWGSSYGATGYQIYRKVGNAATWKYVGTVKATTLSYTDKNVTKGVYYTYTIRAEFGNMLSGYNTTGLKIKR